MADKRVQTRLGGPDRVWATLKSRGAKRKTGAPDVNMDPLGHLYADIESFYHVLSDHGIPQDAVKDAYPDHYLALSWYTSIQPSSQKWYLEALLLTNLTLSEIAALVDPSEPVLAVDVYKRAFFDVSVERKNNPGWMHQYIWGPAMNKNSRLYYYDFVFKLAGFYGGPAMINGLINPSVLPAGAMSWLKSVAQDQRARMTLTFGGVYGKLSPELQVSVTESAVKSWEETARRENDGDVGGESLGKLMDAVQESIGIIKAGEGQSEKYHFISPMYKDAPADKEIQE